jgi:hypothetical protein
MMGRVLVAGVIVLGLSAISISTAGWHVPPVDTQQIGYRGTAMDVIRDRDAVAALKAANIVPESLVATDTTGTKIKDLPADQKDTRTYRCLAI